MPRRHSMWVVLALFTLANCGNTRIADAQGGKAEQGSPSQQTSQLQPLPVVIVGATSEGVKLTRTSTDFRHELQLDSTANGILQVSVLVPPFVGPDTTQVTPSITINGRAATAVSIPPSGVAIIAIQAQLPATGEYRTSINLSAKGHRSLIVPLDVVRSRTSTTVQFRDVETVPGISGEDVTGRFALYETSGQDINIYVPELSGLVRIVSTKREQASFSGQPVVAPFGAEVEKARQGKDTIAIMAGSLQQFQVTIKGLTKPGEYSGRLHVASVDGSMIDETMTFLVHDSAVFAGMLIFVGVIISMLLRWYYRSKRPDLIRLRTLAVVREKIKLAQTQPDLKNDEKNLLGGALARCGLLSDEIERGETDTVDAVLAEIASKVELFSKWVTSRRLVAAISPPALATQFQQVLGDALTVLTHEGSTPQQITDATTALDRLPAAIRKALSDDLVATLNTFKTELAGQNKHPHDKEVTQKLEEVRAKVDEAEARATQDVNESARLIREARGVYTRVLIDEFKNALAGGTPLGLNTAQWTDPGGLKEQVETLLSSASRDPDPQRALEQFQAARSMYVAGITDGLQRQLQILQNKLNAVVKLGQLDNTQIADVNGKLASGKELIDSAKKKVGEGQLDSALEDCANTDRALRLAQAAIDGVAAVMGGPVSQAAALFKGKVPPNSGTREAVNEAWALNVREQPTAQGFTRMLFVWDAVVTAIIALVAVLMGLQVLWAGNPTWGGFGDGLTALLWGLGLHQVSFDGLTNLAQRFKGA